MKKRYKFTILLTSFLLTFTVLYCTYWIGFYKGTDTALCMYDIEFDNNYNSKECIHSNKRIVPFSFIQEYFRDSDTI